MPGQAESRERREHVLSRAVEVGDELAAQEAGVTVPTLLRWRRKAEARSDAVEGERVDGELMVPAEPVVLSDPVEVVAGGELDEREEMRRAVKALRRTAERARERLDQVIPTARGPQQIGVSLGIALDKAERLETLLQAAEDREIRLAQDQAEVIASLFPLALEAAGIPVAPFRPVLGELLRRAGEGGPLAVSPAVAQPAHAAVRGYFERILRDDLEAERRALPAGDDEDEPLAQKWAESLAAGVEVIADAEPAPDEEPVVEAEVVDDERSLEERAAELAERVIARMQAEQTEREGFGVGVHEPRGGGFDMRIPGAHP